MLQIHHTRRAGIAKETLPTVALVGERDRRQFMKRLLRGKATIVAELESGSSVHLLDELLPEMVIIDVGSSDVNPAEAVALANQLIPRPDVLLVGNNEVEQAAA